MQFDLAYTDPVPGLQRQDRVAVAEPEIRYEKKKILLRPGVRSGLPGGRRASERSDGDKVNAFVDLIDRIRVAVQREDK